MAGDGEAEQALGGMGDAGGFQGAHEFAVAGDGVFVTEDLRPFFLRLGAGEVVLENELAGVFSGAEG